MKKIIITSVFLLIATISNAQTNVEVLKKDFVKIENSKMIMEDYTLVKGESNVQIKAHSEAPDNAFISRDRFVYYSGIIFQTVLAELIDQKLETEDLEEITGSPDIEVNCFMGKTGVQVEIKIDGKVTKEMMKWSEVI